MNVESKVKKQRRQDRQRLKRERKEQRRLSKRGESLRTDKAQA